MDGRIEGKRGVKQSANILAITRHDFCVKILL